MNQKIIESQREQIEILMEENRQLKESINPTVWECPVAIHLTPYEQKIFQLLLSREIVTHDQAHQILYSGQADHPGERVHEVFIARIRKKLKPFGIRVINKFAIGFYISSEDKKKIKELGENA